MWVPEKHRTTWEFYLGWQPELQTKMRNFLVNARNTGTVPNMIGWHNLGPSPGDVPETLSRYYRPLENELGIPGRPLPVVIEEHGSGGAKDFEGVPGSMIKHWAEFERYNVDHAMMGIYTNPGLLGNTLRRTSAGLKPNAGWQMMAWYKAMTGTRVDVSRWDTRRYLASDGVASWDDELRTVQILVGGEDNDVDVRVLGLARRGLTAVTNARIGGFRWNEFPDKVGGIDLPDSAVEFAVEAPMTGTYRLEVGYANGTTTTSTHQMYVNGAAAGTVSYPSTGAWFDGPTQDRAGRVAPVTVQLNAGTNRIRLQKGVGYAELDYAELKKTDA
ncbi:CBM35 domain-containing protein [Dactylosporangium sp. CA-152071]|uniref:CBM35 domain-containing protein n=1 Tax=Dactylosporangium sp. CA-152071 TaxID=3239933 RepID=UPI003D91924E